VSDSEIQVTTHAPDPLLVYRLATHFAPIVPQAATEALGDEGMGTMPVGAGPYRIVAFSTDQLVLARHEGYWGGAPAADEVILRYIPEDATRVGALQAGDVDLITNLPVDQIDTIEGADGLNVQSTLLLNYIGVLMNSNVGPLADVNVRRAMALAVDRELIVRELWGGRSRAMDDYLLPGVVGYDGSAGRVRYDLDAARAALAASSYGGEPVIFNPVANYYSNSELPTQVMSQMWTDLGLNMTYEPMDLGSYFQAYLGGTLTSNIQSFDLFGDGMFLFQLWQDNSPIPIYRPNYSVPTPAFDALAAGIGSKFDMSERAADLGRMSDYFAENVPMTPIYQSVEILGVRDGVNIEADALFQLNLRPGSFSM
jgi:peptide/nickel transport system substrate-binding protein